MRLGSDWSMESHTQGPQKLRDLCHWSIVRDLNQRRVPTFDHSRRNPTTRAKTIPISTEHRRITPMNNYTVDTSTTFGETTNVPRKEPIEGPDQWGFIVLREQ
jgi:hypothetical protein